MQHKSIVSFIHSAVEIIFAKTGNSLNVVQSHGYTTLHIAAVNGHHEVAKIILTKVTKKFTDFPPFSFYFYWFARLPGWLNHFNRYERVSTMFNLGMEYDLLRVVRWDIRRYFYFYSPIVRTKKKSCHLHLRSVHCEKLIAIGLT